MNSTNNFQNKWENNGRNFYNGYRRNNYGNKINSNGNGFRIINSLYVNIDGACKGNPGPAAIGIIVKDNYGKVLQEYREFIGNSTNNSAEYYAAIKALEIAASYCRNRVYIFSDSKLLVNHLTGRYRIKKQKLMKLLLEIKMLEVLFQKVKYFYVDREKNEKANILVNSVFSSSNLPNDRNGNMKQPLQKFLK